MKNDVLVKEITEAMIKEGVSSWFTKKVFEGLVKLQANTSSSLEVDLGEKTLPLSPYVALSEEVAKNLDKVVEMGLKDIGILDNYSNRKSGLLFVHHREEDRIIYKGVIGEETVDSKELFWTCTKNIKYLIKNPGKTVSSDGSISYDEFLKGIIVEKDGMVGIRSEDMKNMKSRLEEAADIPTAGAVDTAELIFSFTGLALNIEEIFLFIALTMSSLFSVNKLKSEIEKISTQERKQEIINLSRKLDLSI